MRMTILGAVLALTACAAGPVKVNPAPPAVIKVPVATYVPIDPALTKRCTWVRTAKPSQVFLVSNGRLRCLDQYEAQLDGIEQVQGKPVPDND